MAKTAVILAAGNGTRLAGDKSAPAPSKPLTLLMGVPLVVRTLLTLQSAGFERAVVVTGYRAEEVEQALAADDRIRLELVFARNPEWRQRNGVSVLAAAPYVEEDEFFLTMSDHIFDASILERVRTAELPEGGALLAVDSKLDTIFDMDDATKVLRASDGSIRSIGKEIPEYDAIDTGVFRCSTRLFAALEAAREGQVDCSLSDGIAQLSREGCMGTVDVGDAWWQDVDTPESMAYGRQLLMDAVLHAPRGVLVPTDFARRVQTTWAAPSAAPVPARLRAQ